LPVLIDLTTKERRALTKMGDKSSAFVIKALEVAKQNPDFLPRAFNVEEMRKDVELMQMMQPILMVVNQLRDLVEDTYMQIGSEAYSAVLTVYNYAKDSPSGTALEGAAEELGRRFAHKPKTTEPKMSGKFVRQSTTKYR
jgi:hypothetical protein